jgi:hypothetical protein
VFLGILAVSLGLAYGVARKGNLPDAWRMLREPAYSPIFADAWSIPDSIAMMRAGMDPYVTGALDPLNRPFNYPPIWLFLASHLGVQPYMATQLGILSALLTIIAMLALFRTRTILGGILSCLCVVSWPVLYAVERGNSEQVVFFLLICGFLLLARQKSSSRWISGSALLTFLTMLKIFPIAAMFSLVRNRANVWKVVGATFFAAIALVLTAGPRLSQIVANTRQDIWLSYGSMNFFVTLLRPISPRVSELMLQNERFAELAGLILTAAAIAVGLHFHPVVDRILPRLRFESARGRIAFAALSIYCFTFIRGSSYCYRLMILTGVVAYLVEVMEAGDRRRSLPFALLIVLFLSMTSHHAMVYQCISGLIFVIACAWLSTGLFHQLQDKTLTTENETAETGDLYLVA